MNQSLVNAKGMAQAALKVAQAQPNPTTDPTIVNKSIFGVAVSELTRILADLEAVEPAAATDANLGAVSPDPLTQVNWACKQVSAFVFFSGQGSLPPLADARAQANYLYVDTLYARYFVWPFPAPA